MSGLVRKSYFHYVEEHCVAGTASILGDSVLTFFGEGSFDDFDCFGGDDFRFFGDGVFFSALMVLGF